ncbi:cyclin-dependent protein kinase regulator [Cryptococcus gattii E566]|uniref:Cyclin-dependent protein kinase regulator, putative n=2 Tax=Cryptococcus gattii TaxID=37769 RepID=E6R5Z3_CRYGW|nr:cyclin-dependent protein kinase regulator, putative [Cryptococcus gattii WM276]ADV22622.1 cyclin-dependent protein kinase regulator, putative [Cryptococcus gattii WM276]KIR78380.1 cyclin-dependent protein kinase regulator [Cryptococcus gattii EJB2]KIY33093.1 cyclin-dependent protein kinase regulator [Cryptococcus gattii E566]KJE02894.1 cyclin-dependent protein kinase regulator [Cryptococcus gattii NT-10]
MSHAPHPLATLEQIVSTPSAADGIPSDVENDLRIAGCMLIQEAGVMLKLPQSTMGTAQVLLHRFYYVSSMCSFGINDISISALFLASKLCESPVRLRNLINTYLYLLARIQHLLDLPADQSFHSDLSSHSDGREEDKVWEGFKFSVPGFHDEIFWDWKDVITASEMQILKRLGFNMQVDLPYNHMINYLKILDLVFEDDVTQMCWSILNDMLLTPLYAIHPPHTIACISILLTTRLLRIPLPPKWYLLFDVSYDEIWSGCGVVMRLWNDWGLDRPRGDTKISIRAPNEEEEGKKGKESRWRRAWVLAQSRKAVRRWVEGLEKA